MAGSKRIFNYLTDSGDPFAIIGDESNVEEVNNGDASVPPLASRGIYYVPTGLKPRRAFYSTADNLKHISAVVLTPTAYVSVEADVPNFVVGADTFSFVRKRPEVVRGIRWDDSGLLDGDAEVAV